MVDGVRRGPEVPCHRRGGTVKHRFKVEIDIKLPWSLDTITRQELKYSLANALLNYGASDCQLSITEIGVENKPNLHPPGGYDDLGNPIED